MFDLDLILISLFFLNRGIWENAVIVQATCFFFFTSIMINLLLFLFPSFSTQAIEIMKLKKSSSLNFELNVSSVFFILRLSSLRLIVKSQLPRCEWKKIEHGQ